MHEYPYWWDTAPALRAGSHAAGEKVEVNSQKCDVAIVGAGYTGLAAARHLARAGASVVVFERDYVGAGASSRNGGQVCRLRRTSTMPRSTAWRPGPGAEASTCPRG